MTPELRERALFNVQLSNNLRLRSPDGAQRNPGAVSATRIPDFAALHPGYRHTSSPLFFVRPGAAGLLLSSLPKGRAERQGVSPRPRRPHVFACGHPARCFRGTRAMAQPNAEDRRTEPSLESSPRLRSAREWILRLAACPRGRHWRRRAPVRASCRPDMHLDRSPVLPASVPVRSRISDPQRGQGPASCGHPHPAPRFEDDRTRPSPERDGITIIIQETSRQKSGTIRRKV